MNRILPKWFANWHLVFFLSFKDFNPWVWAGIILLVVHGFVDPTVESNHWAITLLIALTQLNSQVKEANMVWYIEETNDLTDTEDTL